MLGITQLKVILLSMPTLLSGMWEDNLAVGGFVVFVCLFFGVALALPPQATSAFNCSALLCILLHLERKDNRFYVQVGGGFVVLLPAFGCHVWEWVLALTVASLLWSCCQFLAQLLAVAAIFVRLEFGVHQNLELGMDIFKAICAIMAFHCVPKFPDWNH